MMDEAVSLRIVAVLAAAALVAACASERRVPADTPPTPFASMTESGQFGVSHRDRPDGWTEIFVKLNESSTPARARDMARYQAALLAGERNARFLYVARDEAGLECRVTGKKEPGAFAGGDPVSAVLALTFVAVYGIFAPAESWAGYPTHRLLVWFSDSGKPAHGITPEAAKDILAALEPRLSPAVNGAPDPAGAPHDGDDRLRWAADADANEAACAERESRKKNAANSDEPPGSGPLPHQ